jgi:hypothetical protein
MGQYLFEGFSDNLCALVVDTMCDRLRIDDFGGEDAQLLTEIWERNRMKLEHGVVHTAAAVYGDAYVFVWPNEETGKAEIWFNAPELIRVHYNPDNWREVDFVTKRWQLEDGMWRLDIYTPTEIRKYKIKEAKVTALWNPTLNFGRQLEQMGQYWGEDGWELIETTDNPYGVVPVFHFKNQQHDSTHGRSELASVIPQQDAINKVLVTTLLAAEFTAFPQRHGTGIREPKEGFRSSPRRLWVNENPAGRWGQFDAADMEGLIATVEMFMEHVATTSRTPRHLFRGMERPPSGEALKVAEHGLVAKVKSRQVSLGNTWRDVMSFALMVEAGIDTPPEEIEIMWANPAPNTDKVDAEIEELLWNNIIKAAQVIGLEMALRRNGYSERQAKAIVEARGEVTSSNAEIAENAQTSETEGESE